MWSLKIIKVVPVPTKTVCLLRHVYFVFLLFRSCVSDLRRTDPTYTVGDSTRPADLLNQSAEDDADDERQSTPGMKPLCPIDVVTLVFFVLIKRWQLNYYYIMFSVARHESLMLKWWLRTVNGRVHRKYNVVHWFSWWSLTCVVRFFSTSARYWGGSSSVVSSCLQLARKKVMKVFRGASCFGSCCPW